MPRLTYSLNNSCAALAICALMSAFIWAAPLEAATQIPAPAPSEDKKSGTDITTIIRDILGDTPFPAFPGGTTPVSQSTSIDNIPVSITAENASEFDNEWLVVSAYGPPQNAANGGVNDKGELLGQTRLLMRGLTPPFNIVIAAPRAVTEKLEFARVEGRIEDSNGTVVLTSENMGYYKGDAPAELILKPKLVPLGPVMPAETIVKFERTQGEIDIPKDSELFRGAILTVQLTETGLVGGKTHSIKGESRTQLDGQSPPYKFSLEYGVPKGGFKMPLTLSAFITNWAGRKTHVMAKALDYNGPDFDYRLQLDAYRLGGDVADFRFSDPVSAAKVKIEGQAIFNAYKGLPLGSYLQVKLQSPIGPNGRPQNIGSTTVSLRGIPNVADFMLEAPSVNFDPELPTPILEVTIFNSLGNALFESVPAPVAVDAKNLVTLSPLPIY